MMEPLRFFFHPYQGKWFVTDATSLLWAGWYEKPGRGVTRLDPFRDTPVPLEPEGCDVREYDEARDGPLPPCNERGAAQYLRFR